MLTGDNITDEQILALRADVVSCDWPIVYHNDCFIDAPDGRGGYYDPDDIVNWCIKALGVDNDGSIVDVAAHVRQTSRARCAEILNARTKVALTR